MSKAFVHERDAAQAEPAQAEPAPAAEASAPARNYVTPAGYARLEAELRRLVEVERPAVVKIVAWAAANGDRSENGDYIYGKRRLREIDRRVRFLIKRLESAEIVPARAAGSDQVFFGATVTVRSEQNGERVLSIVGVDEAEPARGRVSWMSPIARALIRARAGDTVNLVTPGGVEALDILEVRYLPLD
jgi:transcription elongation factor GreB